MFCNLGIKGEIMLAEPSLATGVLDFDYQTFEHRVPFWAVATAATKVLDFNYQT